MKISIKKGIDLNLEGAVPLSTQPKPVSVDYVAVCPDDFEGFLPKCMVKEGDELCEGAPVLYHKNDPRIKLVSPVSGKIKSVVRGSRRHIDSIIIERNSAEFAPSPNQPIPYNKVEAMQLSEILAEKGLLSFIRQRPYAIIPSIEVRPRDIFVTAFDSAPLAVTPVWDEENIKFLQTGADVLSRITSGKVFLSVRKDSELAHLDNVTVVEVKGPHPAGLPGVQAANIAPVNKGDTVWTLSAETMWRIGRLFLTGRFDGSTTVSVCGSGVTKPYLAKTIIGAPVKPLLENEFNHGLVHMRVISGNVLTGVKVDPYNGFLHYPYTQLAVIPEGDDVDEFMGWASMSLSKMSLSPSYPGRLFRKPFNPDARINGGRRAIIMSGEYDSVIPMGILAEYLIKAINSRDIENMERLGIYEVAPEDFALAECIDTSKLPLQQIVREGLDYLRKELS